MTAEITSHEELRELLGAPNARAATKERTRLHERDREWLAASPFCLMATAGADGSCDVSPKGDPAGFALVLDDTTIALPERPGNRRADGYRNILDNPHVGLIFLIPGPDRHAADQRAGPAGQRRALLRRHGGQGAPAGARRRGGHRADLLPLREGVPPFRAVAARDLAARRAAVPRPADQGGRGAGGEPGRPGAATTARRTPRRSTSDPAARQEDRAAGRHPFVNPCLPRAMALAVG